MLEMSREEVQMASKIQLWITFFETFQATVCDNKEQIVHMLLEYKIKVVNCITNALHSSKILNKLKGTRLFRILCCDNYFQSDEIKQILWGLIRIEYRRLYHNIDFIRDMQNELKLVANQYPYEVHECFAEDIEVQYADFKTWRNEEVKDDSMQEDKPLDYSIMYYASSSLGITLDMFFIELECFCRTKECLNDLLYLWAIDFYTNLYIDNQRHLVWTKGYLETAVRIINDINLGQTETDEVVEKMIEIVFEESGKIFARSTEPVFLGKEYAEPFYHLLRQGIKALSSSKAEILLSATIKVFSDFQPQFEERVKCYDKLCNKKSYYCMNMSLFKIFKYLLKLKEVSIMDSEVFYQVYWFLHMLSMNQINTPALNNLRKESNKSMCMLINKWKHSIPEVDEMVDQSIDSALDIIRSKSEEVSFVQQSMISEAFNLIKGLAIKGSIKAYNTIKTVIELMKDTSDGVRAWLVSNWHNLFISSEFSRKNKFNISPFYKQRMFLIAFPALIESYRETHSNLQNGNNGGIPLGLISRLLIPICSESSYELYKDYIEELIPLIIYSLNVEDIKIKHICLKLIKKLLEEVEVSKINTKDLVLSLTNCLNDMLSTEVKNLSLICIGILISKNFSEVILYKRQLRDKLKKLLDDRKRSTRKLARFLITNYSM